MSFEFTSLFQISFTALWCLFSVVLIKSSLDKFKVLVKSLNFNEISSQNSFGQISYKVGEKVKFTIDTESVVGFFD